MNSTLTMMLLIMVAASAGVSSLGLWRALSISMMEPRRETGVLRTLGARPAAIVGSFVSEGLVVGGLSWLLALPFSYPAAQIFSEALGRAAFGAPLDFSYSIPGALLWLGLVLALSTLASLGPAIGASRTTIREALAYE